MRAVVFFLFIFVVISGCSTVDRPDVSQTIIDQIKGDFLNPPAETRPGCYWYWINDNISKEGITKDLEAMSRVGIGRAYIGHIYNYKPDSVTKDVRFKTPVGDVKFMSDKWWEAVQWAVKEADRCGVEIGFFNSPGWSQSGAPWVKPSQSMRYLAHSETVVDGGKQIDQLIPAPEVTTYPMAGGSNPTPVGPKFTEKDFQDVRVIAFKQPDTEANDIDMKDVSFMGPSIADVENLFDGLDDTVATLKANKELIINLQLPDMSDYKSGIQSINIKPVDDRYVFRCIVACSVDGGIYKQVAKFTEQRGHQGPKRKDVISIPIRDNKARFMRLVFKVDKDAKFSEITVSRKPVIAGFVRKQLGETDPSTTPKWNAYVWSGQPESAPGSALVSGEVVDLTDKIDAEGRLIWDAPEGRWVVLRMGMVPIGTCSHPTSPESVGLEVDKMNKDHVSSLFDGMVGKFLHRTPAEDRKAFKYVIADSYETGPQNWTDGFAEKFKAKFGYSPQRFLPVLTGRVVDSAEVSDRFLWDFRRMIVEGIAYDYVGGLRQICNDNDLTLWLENYGHWGYPSEFLLYGGQSNQVGGEFWVSGVRDNVECRAASSCGRIYGKKDIYAESFTSSHNFKYSPGALKKWCDWLFGVGVNHLILHVNIHQPDERKPGIIQWFGTSFNRHNTWFEQSKGLIDYARRSGVLLKAGLPVIDVAYYIGENAPMMQGPRDPELPDGYDFDYINSDVLINRASVVDGKLVVKDGPGYSVLVLPRQKVMRPKVAATIKRLVADGATIIGPKPVKSPSLENYPACDETVAKIAGEVWGDVDGSDVKSGKYGKGFVYDGLGVDDVLGVKGVEPDVRVVSESDVLCAAAGGGKISIGGRGGITFHHRNVEGSDIYFLANTSNDTIGFTASLRTAGLKPSLWDAVTGQIKQADAFTQVAGRTLIPLVLQGSESVFVVFDGKISETAEGTAKTNEPEYVTLETLKGPWQVSFKVQDAPESIVFNELTDWTKHPNEAIKYYAGTAVYKNSFTYNTPAQPKPVVLELGEVAVAATVYLNDKKAGIVWCTPWEIDITDLLVDGKNDVRIHVVNTWNNRLIADSKLPKDQQKAYVSQPYRFKPTDPLTKGGLLGPVRVKQLK